jgi:hypothetical protein
LSLKIFGVLLVQLIFLSCDLLKLLLLFLDLSVQVFDLFEQLLMVIFPDLLLPIVIAPGNEMLELEPLLLI